MKNLKALLVMGTAAMALSSCETNRSGYSAYNNYGDPNVPVPVQYSKDGHGAYAGNNGYVGSSNAQRTSTAPASGNIILFNGVPELPRAWENNVIVPVPVYYPRHYPRRIHEWHNNRLWGWGGDCTKLGNCRW